MQGPQANWLPDGRRLHLHHGPIDMIVGVEGAGRAVGFARAVARFETLLSELAAELPRLRAEAGESPSGSVARSMVQATDPFKPAFITPMAAVAGAGADAILQAITKGAGIRKAYVNNGGDVAFHIEEGAVMKVVIATEPNSTLTIYNTDRSRGVATSGRGGRSHSFGIADSVTVLADTAAAADAAATMIANAVDLPGHPSVRSEAAHTMSPDSDLGARRVTTGVDALSKSDIETALAAGADYAQHWVSTGVIDAAFLTLRGSSRVAGQPSFMERKDLQHA